MLRQEVGTAVGCTEPAALAFAAAAAAAELGETVEQLHLRADPGTFKNCLSVGLPGTTLRGPAVAAASGALIARPELGLQLFSAATEEIWQQAEEMRGRGLCVVDVVGDWHGVRIEASCNGGKATAHLAGRHDRLVDVRRGGQSRPVASSSGTEAEIDDEQIRRRLGSPSALLAALAELDVSDLDRIRLGLEQNVSLASRSLAKGLGAGVGSALSRIGGDGPAQLAKRWVAAGVEARMSGERAPVTTSGGSGNSGLTVTLGTWAVAQALAIDEPQRVGRAIALAHLINIAVKARIGRVGPLCGAALASSMAVGGAVAWLLGGGEAELDRVIRHQVSAVAGSLCDGAKPACALRVTAGLGAAIDAAQLAVAGDSQLGDAGLAGGSAEIAFGRSSSSPLPFPESTRRWCRSCGTTRSGHLRHELSRRPSVAHSPTPPLACPLPQLHPEVAPQLAQL